MLIEKTSIRDVLIIIPEAHADERGFFMETYRSDLMQQAGVATQFVQDNHSLSVKKGTIRGLHFQLAGTTGQPMEKIMRVTRGAVMLIAVDIRKGSPTLGKHIAVRADAKNRKQLYAPAGFARGFIT